MLTIENFWDASVGIWDELSEIPVGFSRFAGGENGQTSTYYTNAEKTHVVRVSDHWGSGIRECNWYLKGHKRCNAFHWGNKNGKPVRGFIRERIGIIKISDLIDIRI